VGEAAQGQSALVLVGIVGAGEAEIPVLAELHRNRRVHIIGVYDQDPDATGLDLAEILGLRFGSSREFLEHLASAQQVVLPRDRHRYADEIAYLRERGVRFLNLNEALAYYAVDKILEEAPRPATPTATEQRVARLEEALGWLNQALDREELLRALLSIGIQSVEASRGSIQLLDPLTRELYIAYAEGLSDHTIRTSRQKLGEGIAGEVASTRRARLMHGSDLTRYRDRPDILSSICVPLAVENQVLGVLNVSTDLGGQPLTAANLEVLIRVSSRVSPVLARLLEIQALHERALVEDLRREMDRLVQLELDLGERLALSRDLLADLSSAHSCSLVVLTADGPALRLLPGRDDQGQPRLERDLDPTKGILGQVMLSNEPVIMEEKVRAAGERKIRRHLTLYMTLGKPETFAVFVGHFDGLSVLSHFQRNMDRVVDVMTPRLGAMLAQEEARGRLGRLRRLTSGLSVLAGETVSQRRATAVRLFQEQSNADAVALWTEDGDAPCVATRDGIDADAFAHLWPPLLERLGQGGAQRLREIDLDGSRLRSVLLYGDPASRALAAVNRRPDGPLEETGFREEDVDAARMILNSLRAPEPEVAPPTPSGTVEIQIEASYDRNETLLHESVQRELHRAQRYHFGFSITMFAVHVEDDVFEELADALVLKVQTSSRATDCVLWLDPRTFVVLAPEEARGQRRLARRFQDLLLDFLEHHAPQGTTEVRVGSATYPHDAEAAEDLVDKARRELQAPPS
jgi:hypothetical protein